MPIDSLVEREKVLVAGDGLRARMPLIFAYADRETNGSSSVGCVQLDVKRERERDEERAFNTTSIVDHNLYSLSLN